MANKRMLKKQICYMCGDIAGECIMAKYLIEGADKEKLNDAVVKLAEVQTTALARTNVTFDKTPRDFDSLKEYHKARRSYYAKAYKSLIDGFMGQINEVVKEMNAAMPEKKN